MRFLWIAIVSLFAASPAFALIEARLTYGLLASSPDLAALYTGSSTSVPSAAANYGPGADLLIHIPMTGWGFGVRYENLGMTASGSGLDYKSTANRTAVLVSYRLINTILHVGPILSYGLSHSNSIELKDSNLNQTSKWEPDNSSSYQVGLEVGAGLGGLIIGAEAGIQNMKWNKMADKNGVSTATPDTDMSGTYAKVYFGFGI